MSIGKRPSAPVVMLSTMADNAGALWEVWCGHEGLTSWCNVKLVAVTADGNPARRAPKGNYSLGWHVHAARWANSKELSALRANVPELLAGIEFLISRRAEPCET